MSDLIVMNESKINEYLEVAGVSKQINPQQRKTFIEIAVSMNLNPWKREIYAIPFNGQLTIVTGYEVYLKRAERTGDLDGWNTKLENDKCTITIYRKSMKNPIIHEVFIEEFRKDTKIWKQMPKHMLRKVAISQGMRLAFPDELAGIYTADELDGRPEISETNDVPIDVTPYEPKPQKSKVFIKAKEALENSLPDEVEITKQKIRDHKVLSEDEKKELLNE